MNQEYEKRIENVRNEFIKNEYEAKLRVNTEDYKVIEWGSKTGKGYIGTIRYAVDEKTGDFIISGGMGECIANGWAPHKISDIYKYLKPGETGYFMSKFRCASREDYFDETVAREYFDDLKESLMELDDFDEDEYDEFVDIYIRYEGHITENEIPGFVDYECIINDIGMTTDPAVYYWQIGFRMAYEQLYVKEKMYNEMVRNPVEEPERLENRIQKAEAIMLDNDNKNQSETKEKISR